MNGLEAFLVLLLVPLLILNILGGIVAGIWLIILGEWVIVVEGLLIAYASNFILSFAMLPMWLFAKPAIYFSNKGKTIGMVCFTALSNLYILAVITFWCCGIMFYFIGSATESNLIPRLLWTYGLAIGPWTYFARQDGQGGRPESFASMIATFFAQIGYVTIMVLVIFTNITLIGTIKAFACFMAVAMLFLMTLATLIRREMKT